MVLCYPEVKVAGGDGLHFFAEVCSENCSHQLVFKLQQARRD